MATETSSIDDVLMSSHIPHQDVELPVDRAPEIKEEQDAHLPTLEQETYGEEESESHEESSVDADEEKVSDDESHDEYGNEKPKQESKTYTEDEVNERINKAVRERLARLKDSPETTQKPAQDFKYNEESEQNWEQQLASFVEQTVQGMTHKQQQQAQAQREQAEQQQFEEKFHNSMGKFQDFRDVVGSQPITDAMTIATRAMSDPAAFLYAASKRHPTELSRISQIPDPYKQMVEMGKLEERMRKNKATTSAPKPISKTTSESTLKMGSNQKKEVWEESIEDQIARADAKKAKLLLSRPGRR